MESEGRVAGIATVEAFVTAQRRERWLADLDRPMLKRRKTVRLHDTRDFDARFLQPVPNRDHSARGVAKLLRERGAPDEVWLMTPVDVEAKPLDEAVAEIVTSDANEGLIICRPGRLVYLQTEVDGGFLLVR